MLKFWVLLFFAILTVSVSRKKQKCLGGAGHKYKPTPENNLQECTLYAKSSCCHADITEELAHSPVIKVNTTYWNRCGNLSKLCESYMKKVECFYQCSPYAALWAHQQYEAAIDSVPMCQHFCDNWYEACKNDLTCVKNWLTDWEIDENGENHCKNECISFRETYANGTDMCETMWGSSLKVSDSNCLCLQMDEMDDKVINLMKERSSRSISISRSISSSSSSSSISISSGGSSISISSGGGSSSISISSGGSSSSISSGGGSISISISSGSSSISISSGGGSSSISSSGGGSSSSSTSTSSTSTSSGSTSSSTSSSSSGSTSSSTSGSTSSSSKIDEEQCRLEREKTKQLDEMKKEAPEIE